jgi:GTP-binding protein
MSNLPVIALVGRPNVGKSTLFNALTRSRDALVAALPGLTRDRIYGFGRVGDSAYLVVDTGGLTRGDAITEFIARQTDQAIAESDLVLFVVDARAGLVGEDRSVAERLRRSGKPVLLVVNKSEGLDTGTAAADFFSLGFTTIQTVSAAHGHGINDLVAEVLTRLPPASATDTPEIRDAIRIAVVGRPNAGKSTLVNRLLGEERVLTFDAPGTTRDSIHVPFERDGERYVLIDTAGIRRRARVDDMIEKLSVIKALQAIEQAHVVIAMVDARQGIGSHDAHLLGLVAQRGRAMVVAVNKWDGLASSERRRIQRETDRKLPFLDYAPLHFISALHGGGLGELFESVNRAYEASVKELSTPQLTRVLEKAVEANAPPAVVGRRIKLRYAHQGGRSPPTIVIHGNQTDALPVSYHRYLAHRFREAFDLVGAPLRLEFRTGENPYGKQQKPAKKKRPAKRSRTTRTKRR